MNEVKIYKNAKIDSNNPKTFTICLECGYLGRDLTSHITRAHKMKGADYKIKHHVDKLVCDEISEVVSKRVSGENNPAWQHGGKFSPYSEKFVYADTTDRKALIEKAIKTRSDRGNDTTTIKYYLKKTDGDEAEAAKLLKERQTTFSLEKCIEELGEIDGHKRWKERQIKWIDALDSKSDEEKARINRLKATAIGSISKAEKELFEEFSANGIEVHTQFALVEDNKRVYVYDFRLNDKIIEYHGDYWHANPEKYESTYFNKQMNKSAQEIWERDSKKEEYARSKGYTVLVVRESNYNDDKKKVIEECMNFLRS